MWALLVVAGVLCIPAPAWAAPCGKPDLLYALPPNGADNVPTDATPSAIYVRTADYLGEDVSLDRADGTQVPGEISFDPAEAILTFKPDAPLEPGQTYTAHWPELRGIATASKGTGKDVTFTVGQGPDSAAPVFDGLTGVDWDVQRERDSCTNSIAERFVFDLDLSTASDDSGRDALGLVVFQTSGPGVGAPEPVEVRAIPSGNTVRVTRSIDEATGHICFAALVRDLTGKTSASANRTVCADTIKPPFFYGCRVASGRRPADDGWLGVLALGALALVRRRAR